MIRLSLFLLFCLFNTYCIGQKKDLDTSVLGKWPDPFLFITPSGNGQYIHYRNAGKTIVKCVKNAWTYSSDSVMDAKFTDDSKSLVFTDAARTLKIAELGTMREHFTVSNATSFDVYPEWIAFQLRDSLHKVFFYNYRSRKRLVFTDIYHYAVNKNTGMVVLYHKIGTELVFSVIDLNKNRTLHQVSAPEVNGFTIARVLWFSNDKRQIFFSLKKIDEPVSAKRLDMVSLDVWSYFDPKLQSTQLQQPEQPREYKAVVNISTGNTIRLEQDNEFLAWMENDPIPEEYFILGKSENRTFENSEWGWNKTVSTSLYAISSCTGNKFLIKNNIAKTPYSVSPQSRYVVFYDAAQKIFLSYDISKRTFNNISAGIQKNWTVDLFAEINVPDAIYHVNYVGWLPNDSALIVADNNDLFRLDPSGRQNPICITNNYGKRNNVSFSSAFDGVQVQIYKRDKILLSAVDNKNGDEGFFTIPLNKIEDPEKLVMQACTFKGAGSPNVNQQSPVKAKLAELYIVRKMSAYDFPNYFVTSDFVKYTQVTERHPEKEYNWLTAELVSWQLPDSSITKGILYKPEQFDSSKKYPVIVYFYEHHSEALHSFILPEYSDAEINIPWYVSLGYLVFTPDIKYTIGEPGESALRSVTSGVDHLSKRSYVDDNKIGLQGESFGAYQVNYIITRTNRYAAAMASAGVCNFISGYGSLRGRGETRQHFYEHLQSRIGKTLWESPSLYIRNSPLFNADKIQTPLLMMNNRDDGQVPFAQGVEFFTALRRLGKKAWMLQYDNGEHGVYGNDAIDYTRRVQQFFDHYLKDSLPPKWMTRGIPASVKQIDDGLELDTEIKTPGQGLLLK